MSVQRAFVTWSNHPNLFKKNWALCFSSARSRFELVGIRPLLRRSDANSRSNVRPATGVPDHRAANSEKEATLTKQANDFRGRIFSREDIFARGYFREKIFSREDIFAGRYFREFTVHAKISSRENIFPRKYLLAKISSRENI